MRELNSTLGRLRPPIDRADFTGDESRCAEKSLGSRRHRTQARPASCSLCCPCPRVRRAAALTGDIPDGPACECSIYRPRWPCPA